jgi:hypothetical protein
MRRALIVVVFAAMTALGATKQPPTAALSAQASGQSPQEPRVTEISPTMLRFLEWAVTQGGLTVVLLFVLYGYRRDFFKKDADLRAELEAKERDLKDLKQVLREVAAANQAHAIAVVQNTNATQNLAESLDRFAERRAIQRRDGEP